MGRTDKPAGTKYTLWSVETAAKLKGWDFPFLTQGSMEPSEEKLVWWGEHLHIEL